MFQSKKAIREATDRIVASAANLQRGEVLLLTTIESLCQLDRYDPPWGRIVFRVRRDILKTRGIALRPITNVGYRLCTADEQLTECPYGRQKRAVRQMARAIKEIEGLPTAGLSVHQQRIRALTAGSLRSQRKEIKKAMREQSHEIRKTDTLPRPAIPSI